MWPLCRFFHKNFVDRWYSGLHLWTTLYGVRQVAATINTVDNNTVHRRRLVVRYAGFYAILWSM